VIEYAQEINYFLPQETQNALTRWDSNPISSDD
jgi:hypothetical protein